MNHSPKKRRNEWPKGIFRDIFVCSKQELSPFGIVFVLSAENFEERDLGTIFGIIKVDDFSENSSYVANLLVSVIKKEYFSKLHRSPEESFEISLRKANLALAELARHGSLDWSGKINFVSGALERNNLHFACLGNVCAFFVIDGQIAQICRDLEEEREAETHPLKTFSNISSGKLEKGDKLIFSTDDLNEIFSKEELRQNAAHFSREEFPHFLEVSLEANSQLAGAIVLDFAHEPKIKTPAFPEAPAGRQETLEYAGAKPAKKIDSFVEFPEEPEVPSVSEILPAESREGVPVWKKILFSLKNLFLRVSDGIKKYFLKFFSYLRNFQYRDKVRNLNIKKTLTATYYFGRNAQYSFIRAKNRFQELESAKKKRYAGIFAAAALVLAIALVFAIRSKNTVQPAPPAQNIPVETKPVLALDDIEARSVENIEEVASLPREGAEIAILSGTLYTISGQDKSVVKKNPETT